MDITFPDFLGYCGVTMIVAAYFWQQAKGVARDDWRHPALNGVGAALLLYSLFYRPNPPSIVIELVWLAISAYGIWRALRARTAKGPN
jgi:amino acid transporter